MNETARQASEPVKSRASDIADLLRDEILLGQYRPGERLPSERDLAARFQVNRGAVREAIKTLALRLTITVFIINATATWLITTMPDFPQILAVFHGILAIIMLMRVGMILKGGVTKT